MKSIRPQDAPTTFKETVEMRMTTNKTRSVGYARVALGILLMTAAWAWAQPRDQTLIVAQGLDPRSLSPLSSTTQQEKNVSNQIVERLINFTLDGTGFIPVLAESWSMMAPDTLQVRLRQGVEFTNGEPLDATAAKYSVDALIASPAYTSFVSVLDRTEIVDDYTLNVIAKQPTPERLIVNSLALGAFIYPPVYTQEVGMLEGFSTAPVGTGPYMLESWVRDDRIVLKANPDYWGGEPGVSYLVFRPIAVGAARVAALEAGDIDLSIEVPLDAFDRVDRNPNLVAVSAPGNRTMKVTFSTKPEWGGPLTDVNVRRALMHAVDVEAIVDTLLLGQARILQGQILTPNTFGYNPNLTAVPYDPDLARQMLADAGYPNGFEVTFKYPAGRYAQDKEISEAIAAMFTDVGLTVNQIVLEPGTWLDQLLTLDLRDMYYGGGLSPTDAHFKMVEYGCNFIYSYGCNPEVDRLTELAQFETDEDARLELYHEITQLIYDDAVEVMLFAPNDLYAHRSRVVGWEPSLDQYLDFSGVSFR